MDWSQIVLVTTDEAYYGSEAVAKICRSLEGLEWIGQLGQVAPSWMRESVFQVVSRHRQLLGETDSCRLDLDGTYEARFLSDPVDIGTGATTDSAAA